jgi:predicted RNA-binding protein YlxR (DUF448 family)
VACRTARDKRDLVRVVRTPDGRVILDPTGRLAGRGAYLCRDAACWTAGARRGALDRALGAPIPDDVRAILAAGPDTIEPTIVGSGVEPTPRTTTTGGGTHGT